LRKNFHPPGKEVCAFFFFFFEDSEVQKSCLTTQLKMQQDLIEVQLKLLQDRLDVATVFPVTKDDIKEDIKRVTQNR
jgi:hypothetical protein